ncbi:MAG: hypothetical protein HRU13_09085 [Phycisphaerales bacterium]|nr:hypothetical protein [Phycisphaerales bacterium]
MATVYWIGRASAVAQVSSATPGGTISGETFTISVDGVAIASYTETGGGGGEVQGELVTLWNASTDPRATGITASADGGSDAILLTADTAGVPFTVTLNTPGGSATFVLATPTASAGPNDWSTAANWSGGAVPVNSDDVVIEASDVDICWGLAQSGVTLDSLTIKQTYTGRIGLRRDVLATSSDARTVTTDAEEYRDRYLAISSTLVSIGQHDGPDTPAGSARILLDTGSNQTNVEVHNTASTPAEVGKPAVRLLMTHASNDLFVRRAPGGVGVAVDVAGETSTVGNLVISSQEDTTRVSTGDGVSLTNWEQWGGTNVMRAAGTVATAKVEGGSLRTEGADYTITTLTIDAGECDCNHDGASGNAVTTANVNGGLLNGLGSGQFRKWRTVNLGIGSELSADNSITITTLNEPTTPFLMTVAEA